MFTENSDEPRTYKWKEFRTRANLHKKDDDMLTEYLEAFFFMCRKVCNRLTPEDIGTLPRGVSPGCPSAASPPISAQGIYISSFLISPSLPGVYRNSRYPIGTPSSVRSSAGTLSSVRSGAGTRQVP